MKYKCLIIDDESLARELIATHLSNLTNFELVASCSSAIDASRILRETHIDLMFLDIEMPVLKGTDFYKNLIHKPQVIFTTAYRDYAIDGFDLNAVDYLLKPITFERFFKAIEKFNSKYKKPISVHKEDFNIQNESKGYIYIRMNRKQVKLKFDDILYIESLKDYIKIYFSNDCHVVKYAISTFAESLDPRFIRVHRSFIVNNDKITSFTKHDIEIGDIEIPIGSVYRERVVKVLSS